jgi:hypothetical protein
MRIPKWITTAAGSILVAGIIFLCGWIFNTNAKIIGMQKDDQAIYEKYRSMDDNTGKAFEKIDKRFDRFEGKLDRVLYRR